MTILEALNWGRERIKSTLEEKITQGHNPMLDAQVLLSYTLKKPTSYLFSHFEDELPLEKAEIYQGYIERRSKHEPVAYITGSKEFYKRKFRVNKFVLVPRPETELMIDEALKLIDERSTVIDVGTGSGAIAITLAAEKDIPVIATDVDSQALAIARVNATELGVTKLISFLEGDLLLPYIKINIHDAQASSAIICANLPYARIQQWPVLDPDVQNYEPKKAIVGGVDGLDFYDRLLQQIEENRDHFPATIHLLLEIDPSQEISGPRLVTEHFPMAKLELLRDLAHKPRLIVAQI
ncbi:peptide chain release factor N(5)-glutamine methyltransferase [Patescibacteria group bacterium]|nr:peptide chain release factor N(5)-glutamine methyltransferase [Patescibacteria group bacterium]